LFVSGNKDEVIDVEKLKVTLAEWSAMLGEVDLLPDLTAKIRLRFEQITFLLSEIETCGYEQLAEHSRTLFGLGFSVIKVAGTIGKVGAAMSGLFQFYAGKYAELRNRRQHVCRVAHFGE
jgi:hypothetical protein